MCVGQSVCVTALRVCVLRGWRGNDILCVTERSEIHTDYTHTPGHTHTPADHAHTTSQQDTPLLMMSQADGEGCEEAEPEEDVVQLGERMKQSSVISYQVSSDWLTACCSVNACSKPRLSPLIGHGD